MFYTYEWNSVELNASSVRQAHNVLIIITCFGCLTDNNWHCLCCQWGQNSPSKHWLWCQTWWFCQQNKKVVKVQVSMKFIITFSSCLPTVCDVSAVLINIFSFPMISCLWSHSPVVHLWTQCGSFLHQWHGYVGKSWILFSWVRCEMSLEDQSPWLPWCNM